MSNRRTSQGISSRSVVHLTPDQVSRKRALDRENQRATRAKTKERLSQLENELSEVRILLAAAHQEISKLQENAKAMQNERTRLQTAIEASYLSMQLLRNSSHNSMISQLTPLSPKDIEQQPLQTAEDVHVDCLGDQSINGTNLDPDTANFSKNVDKYSSSQWHIDFPTAEGFSCGHESWESTFFDQDWLPYLLEEAPKSGPLDELMGPHDAGAVSEQDYAGTRELSLLQRNLNDSHEEAGKYSLLSTKLDAQKLQVGDASDVLLNPILMDVSETWEDGQLSNQENLSFQETRHDEMLETTNAARNNQPPWALLPKLSAATCRLDYVLGNLISTRKRSREDSQQELSDPAFPSIASLLNLAERGVSSISNDIAKQIVDFTAVKDLPERIAILWMFSLITRWHISSTEKNYESLPWFMRPTPIQTTCPHPLWIECVVWPEARVQIIQNLSQTQFDTFRCWSNKTLSVNWPYNASSALVLISDSKVAMNPVFEQHLRNMDNWSVGQELVDALPYLAESVKVKKTSA